MLRDHTALVDAAAVVAVVAAVAVVVVVVAVVALSVIRKIDLSVLLFTFENK